MTSAFSWQNSISLCPASFRIPSPQLDLSKTLLKSAGKEMSPQTGGETLGGDGKVLYLDYCGGYCDVSTS